MKTQTSIEVAGPYPTASYPYGKPTACRTVWHVSTVAQHSPAGSIWPSLPLAAFTVTRYDDKPRKYHVQHESDFSRNYFTAPSFSRAISGIESLCATLAVK